MSEVLSSTIFVTWAGDRAGSHKEVHRGARWGPERNFPLQHPALGPASEPGTACLAMRSACSSHRLTGDG